MNSKPVVLGFDGSPASRKALEYAATLAHRFDAPVVVIHVVDWSPFQLQTHEDNEEQSLWRQDKIKADREKLFPPVLTVLRNAGLEAEANVVFGHPAEALAAEASSREALALVLGKTGLSRIKNILFGSVASNTVLLSKQPVIIVP